MNPIIQKLDYNTYFDRQLEAYLLATRQELSKFPPDFDKLSRAKEDFRDNIFNRLIKMINQSTIVLPIIKTPICGIPLEGGLFCLEPATDGCAYCDKHAKWNAVGVK